MSINITVDATDALQKLKALVKRVEESEPLVADLSTEMAENIVTIAKGLVPVDTGKLQESIRYEGEYPSFTFISDATNKDGVQYGIFPEFGTSKQEPQPFLNPAVQEGLQDAKIIIKQEVARALRGK